MSKIIESLKNKLNKEYEAAKSIAAFAEKLFANCKGFDFAAALDSGNENALKDFIGKIEADRDQFKSERDEKAAIVAEVEGLIGEDLTGAAPDGDDKPESKPDVAAAVSKKIKREVVTQSAKIGIDLKDAPKDPPAESLNAFETWSAMKPGFLRTKFYRENKEEIFQLAREAGEAA